MTTPHASRTSPAARQRERLKDEIYRHMFRVEEKRPGAEMDLAVTLLQAWMAPCIAPRCSRQWLRKVCPVCLDLLQSARGSLPADHPCAVVSLRPPQHSLSR